LLALCLFACLIPSAAAGGSRALDCYRARDKVDCFLERAKAKFARVKAADERADAAGELLYTLAVLGAEDAPLLQETLAIAGRQPLAPYREMSLLYAIDLYQFALDSPLATASQAAATRRFAELEGKLQGHDLLDLYIGACSMLDWEDDFLGRWAEFLADSCSEDKLLAVQLDSDYDRAWLLAMMPVAATVAGDRDAYLRDAGLALAWLEQVGKSGAGRKNPRQRNFVDAMGTVMQSLNATSLDIFEQPDGAAAALDEALRHLHRLERRAGITGATTPLRRTLAEALTKAGRDKEGKALLRAMLRRIDQDPKGRRIALGEQVAILALAANLADYADSGGASAAPAAETQDL
jgi:hypothetical protein